MDFRSAPPPLVIKIRTEIGEAFLVATDHNDRASGCVFPACLLPFSSHFFSPPLSLSHARIRSPHSKLALACPRHPQHFNKSRRSS